jgi:hypothetical protein
VTAEASLVSAGASAAASPGLSGASPVTTAEPAASVRKASFLTLGVRKDAFLGIRRQEGVLPGPTNAGAAEDLSMTTDAPPATAEAWA